MWNEQAWQRHLVLSKQTDRYGSELDWHYYPQQEGGMIFLNQRTAEEHKLDLTNEQIDKVFFGPKLLPDLPFLQGKLTFTGYRRMFGILDIGKRFQRGDSLFEKIGPRQAKCVEAREVFDEKDQIEEFGESVPVEIV